MTASRRVGLQLASLLAASMLLGGCGSSDSSPPSNAADATFNESMTSHLQAATEMAELAIHRAQQPDLKQFAREMARANERTTRELQLVQAELISDGQQLPTADYGQSEHEHNIDHDIARLVQARNFDKTFVDMIIPHHAGTIKMSNRQLEDGENPKLKAIARSLIATQAAEIERLQELRKRWFGARLSAEKAASGPAPDESGSAHDGADGSGH